MTDQSTRVKYANNDNSEIGGCRLVHLIIAHQKFWDTGLLPIEKTAYV